MSDSENDRFWAATFDAQGRILAAGHVNVGGNHQLAVARILASTGELDATFGTGGVALVDAVVGGTVETARGIGVQSDGKIVLCGIMEHDPNTTPVDADGVVARLLESGALDSSFGSGGLRRLDFGAGDATVQDFLHDVKIDSQDRIVVFGSKKAEARPDRDRVIARLTRDGALDTGFNGTGVYTLDVDGLELNDTGRAGTILAGDVVLSSGYTPVAGSNQVVLIMLDATGAPVSGFGTNGLVRHAAIPAPGMAEAYGAVRQSTGGFVTTGYGRTASSGQVDVVSFRYLADGTPDTTWSAGGGYLLDVAGADDRGRNVAVLPDDRIVMVGSAVPTPGNLEALVVRLTSSGSADATFGDQGVLLQSYGRDDEAFFGVAVSPDGTRVAAVGYRAGGGEDDDGILLILPAR